MAEDGHRVLLNVYDLSQGLARQLSASFLGKTIEGIWHTGIVVYGNEYYFGGGINHDPAGRTPYGTPLRVVELGVTHVPKEVFEDYLNEIRPRYTAETYNLLTHNCNNFSNEVAQFLVGATIPNYILRLPDEVMSGPMAPLIMPMIRNVDATLRHGAVPQATQFTPTPSNTVPSALPKLPLKSTDSSHSEKLKVENQAPNQETKAEEKKNKAPQSLPAEAQTQADVEKAKANDPLGEARSKVQEEITKEFAAIMASGTLRANEAARLAMRKVMERYGRLDVPTKQS